MSLTNDIHLGWFCLGRETKHQLLRGMKDLGQLQKTLAPVTSANLFKTEAMLGLPRATLDVSIFLSREARLRQPSSLKAGSAGLNKKVISLATGRPSPNSYPFERLEMEFSDLDEGAQGQADRKSYATVIRNDPSSSIDLSIALSYGFSLGHEQLIRFLTTHISYVHCPPYADWEVCLSCGNTSALEIAFRNFANPGDAILVEEYTYSGTIEAAKPLGLTLIPVPMDKSGLCPRSLEEMLLNWSDRHPNKPKPKLIYTIPTGQNPSGITQPTGRRRAVLEVVERHNLLLIEDDPYYYHQFQKTVGESYRPLLPSYLSLCASGRVVRLDSTSKILAPGLRLGWLTAPRSIVETFQASHDLSVVHPSGLSQLVVYKLLSEVWGHAGFFQWLRNLAKLYHDKATATENALGHYLGTGDLAKVCSWTAIEAGMFLWLKINCATHPNWKPDDEKDQYTQLLQIEDVIYQRALEEGVLCCKGSLFKVPAVRREKVGEGNCDMSLDLRTGKCTPEVHFRLTFACVEAAELFTAAEVLSRAIRASFRF